MSIDYERPEVAQARPNWELVDSVRRAHGVKRYLRRLRGVQRLTPESEMWSEDATRQKDYEDAAIFYNITGHTLRGLVGTAFRHPMEVDLPGALEHLEDDSDGQGNSLVQQAKGLLRQLLVKGRAGLWVDYPVTGGEVSQAEASVLRPRIHRIQAEQIINWSTAEIQGRTRLRLVVLKYTEEVEADYEVSSEERIRELGLDESSRYFVREWREVQDSATGKKVWQEGEQHFPTDSSGAFFTEIPFTFVGADNNDPSVDEIPLLDMATINVGHYRNSADFEDSVFYAGQSQPWMSGATDEVFDLIDQYGIRIGSRQLFPVPAGETFGFATPDPNPLVRQAMVDKVDMMIGLGARFIRDSGPAKTASESQDDSAKAASSLSTVAQNLVQAYNRAIGWAGRFAGADGGVVSLDTDFSYISRDPQSLAMWVKSYLEGAVPEHMYIGWMKRNGYFPRDMDDETISSMLGGVEPESGAGGADSNLGEV